MRLTVFLLFALACSQESAEESPVHPTAPPAQRSETPTTELIPDSSGVIEPSAVSVEDSVPPPSLHGRVRNGLSEPMLAILEHPERVYLLRERRRPPSRAWRKVGSRSGVALPLAQRFLEELLSDESYTSAERSCGQRGIGFIVEGGGQRVRVSLNLRCRGVSFSTTERNRIAGHVGYLRPDIAERWTQMLSERVRTSLGPEIVEIMEHPETVTIAIARDGHVPSDFRSPAATLTVGELVHDILVDENHRTNRRCRQVVRGYTTYMIRLAAAGESVELRLRMPGRDATIRSSLMVENHQNFRPLTRAVARRWMSLVAEPE